MGSLLPQNPGCISESNRFRLNKALLVLKCGQDLECIGKGMAESLCQPFSMASPTSTIQMSGGWQTPSVPNISHTYGPRTKKPAANTWFRLRKRNMGGKWMCNFKGKHKKIFSKSEKVLLKSEAMPNTFSFLYLGNRSPRKRCSLPTSYKKD